MDTKEIIIKALYTAFWETDVCILDYVEEKKEARRLNKLHKKKRINLLLEILKEEIFDKNLEFK